MVLCKVRRGGRISLPPSVRREARIGPGDTVRIRAIAPGKIEIEVLAKLTLDEALRLLPIEGPIDLSADRQA